MTQFRDNTIRNWDRAIGEFSQAWEINAIGVNIERNANWQDGGDPKSPLSRNCKVDEFYVCRKCNISFSLPPNVFIPPTSGFSRSRQKVEENRD